MQFDFLLPWFVCLPKILHKFRYTFLVPNESAWQPLQRQQEVMVWISAWREIYLQINKLGSFFLFFFQFQLLWANESLPVISWFWKFFDISLFGCFQFWVPTHIPEVICPRYDPDQVSHFHLCTATSIDDYLLWVLYLDHWVQRMLFIHWRLIKHVFFSHQLLITAFIW